MFPDRMISLMKLKKITKKQMSEDCGFGINQIKYWQTNHNTPDAVTMTKIANKLEVSTMYLMELIDDPDPIALIDPSKKDPPLLPLVEEAGQQMAALAALGGLVDQLTDEQVAELRRYAEFLVSKNKEE